jgi:hypothetical protein
VPVRVPLNIAGVLTAALLDEGTTSSVKSSCEFEVAVNVTGTECEVFNESVPLAAMLKRNGVCGGVFGGEH